MSTPRFLFDVGSPYAYLAGERIEELLGPVRWEPVLLGGIFRATGRASWAQVGDRDGGVGEIERRAAARGLPPLRWPDPWPNDGLLAMRAATWAGGEDPADGARRYGRAAMRIQFAEGRPLSDPENVAAALTAAGFDAAAGLAGAADAATKQRLRAATDAALAEGVYGVPTVAVGPFRLWGDDRLEDAAAILRAAR
ncbi:2-hydroxychromene-2-carboxylate isomerase [Patulibacter defluvii]|uniref:2-hydroxychromene-2-carboxylate isomerase n=1 Tax=Patulibacter defluvii TaxID=3095358 RepID=UPI002A7647AE|nr:DsbA family protein [Patulibacter sp. DM4]